MNGHKSIDFEIQSYRDKREAEETSIGLIGFGRSGFFFFLIESESGRWVGWVLFIFNQV